MWKYDVFDCTSEFILSNDQCDRINTISMSVVKFCTVNNVNVIDGISCGDIDNFCRAFFTTPMRARIHTFEDDVFVIRISQDLQYLCLVKFECDAIIINNLSLNDIVF